MHFKNFNLKDSTLLTLTRLRFLEPSLVQEKVIPAALKGESLLVRAPTGSGKSHAFILPILEKIKTSMPMTQALIIVPTLELGRQTYEFIKEFQPESPKLSVKFLDRFEPGKTINSHIIIATAARVTNIKENSGLFDFSQVKILVLDEADMLGKDDFFTDIMYLISFFKNRPQVLVFSATYVQDLRQKLVRSFHLKTSINVEAATENIKYFAIDIKHQSLMQAITNLIKAIHPYLLIIFASTIEQIESISEYLVEKEYKISKIHGKMPINERKTAFNRVKSNESNIIVTSDLMARGIDFSDVSDVLSVDVPKDTSFFFHRSGRTARFDKEGNSYLFYNVDSASQLPALERLGANFHYYSLGPDGIKEKKAKPLFLRDKKSLDPKLQQEISQALRVIERHEVKPNYKKKAKVVRQKAIKKHNQKLLKDKIRREKYGRK